MDHFVKQIVGEISVSLVSIKIHRSDNVTVSTQVLWETVLF